MPTKKTTKFKTYKLSGDILHAGFIHVQARNATEARALAKAGDFTVADEMEDTLGFEWDGNPVEEVE
jgi:hypothetical protein